MWKSVAGLDLLTVVCACSKGAEAELALQAAADKAMIEETIVEAKKGADDLLQKTVTERDSAKAAVQKSVDEVEQKLGVLRERAAKGTAAQRADAAKAMHDVEAKRATLRADMAA